jgi:nicotinate-nucleotide pyrophosphorylase (carboxylating)
VAIARAREVGSFPLLLDVRMRDEEEANEAIVAGANMILLNNIEGNALVFMARRLRERWKGEGRKFLPETNWGISVRVDVDILSTSSVHQSVPHTDFGLKIQMPPR